ncbi:hypothetical protein [Saccharothrix sp. ST-888]|uniref:hypothetical protein n=1 Tax=Saccharothrix sp. ST-888 TaxID=1427391 RepID=UPI0005EC94CF|nr:hypothetical protein [Saccharothrix sp. ST-888]KJK59278.1 hypothetical protein UK12_05505 [Saccharothrix sp. ST-888]
MSTSTGAAAASATAVSIERLTTTLHPGAAEALSASRLDGPLRHLVGGCLAQALDALRLPPGRWCVRRIDVTVPLDPGRTDAALASSWSEVLAAAIERAVRDGSGEVVHYRHEIDLLAEFVAGSAAGRTERSWAWRQAAVLRPGDPSPSTAPGAAILTALTRSPQHAAAVLLRAAAECGLPALDRALGRDGWQRAAALVALASWSEPARPGSGHNHGPGPGSSPGHRTGHGEAAAEVQQALARRLVNGSRLAELVRRSRLRPEPGTLAAWAVLVVAETDPASLHRRPHPALPAVLAGELTARPGRPAWRAPRAPEQRVPDDLPETELTQGHIPSHITRSTTEEAPPAPAPSAVPAPAPADPGPPGETDGGVPTSWAGLLFLLATAAEAGLPDRILDEPALAARPLRWALHSVGRALLPAVAADDAALLALAGLDAARAGGLLDSAPATPDERRCVEALARDWAAVTAARLHPDRGSAGMDSAEPEDPAEVIVRLARREGLVSVEPGWLELRLPVSGVAVEVRRAGLDLDPGWVPWLGVVVRYVYA